MGRAADHIMTATETEIAWLAGLYEGEGYLSQQNSTKHRYWTLGVTMTDEDVVRRAHQIGGTGSFIGPMLPPSLAQYKPQFRWTVNAQQHIEAVTDALYPLLGERRRARIDQFREWRGR